MTEDMTPDQLALACDHLGLKGALRYDSYESMVKSWHDPNEPIPIQLALWYAWQECEPKLIAEREEEETSRTRASELPDLIDTAIVQIDAGSITSLAKALPILKLLLVSVRLLAKAALKGR